MKHKLVEFATREIRTPGMKWAKSIIRSLFALSAWPLILLRWVTTKRSLHLRAADRKLFFQIHYPLLMRGLGFPDLKNPKTYNDRIQWLKIFDHRPELVELSDKSQVRSFVASHVGDSVLIPMLMEIDAGKSLLERDFRQLPNSFVIKKNNDSGSTLVVRDKGEFDLMTINAWLGERNEIHNFGIDSGEWPYTRIPPKFVIEEHLRGGKGAPIDFKFHCSEGEVKFVQVISGRGLGVPYENILDREGTPLGIKFDHRFGPDPHLQPPSGFDELIEIAETLARDFAYVRVDLYWEVSRPWFGEMTFFPLGGFYKGAGQETLGNLLTFNNVRRRPRIHLGYNLFEWAFRTAHNSPTLNQSHQPRTSGKNSRNTR